MKDQKTMLKAAIAILIAVFSMFVITKYASSPTFHADTIQVLDEKKTTVMQLTAASTAASAAITLIPGDAATPIAENLADLSSYFLIVICALYLEKYLVTITGYATFAILIPLACVCYAVSLYINRKMWQNLSKKLAIFGCAIFLVIPTSVKLSQLIETTYSSSIQETIETATQTTQEIKESTQEKQGGLSGIISNIQGEISDLTNKVEHSLNNFIEALAVMIVTSCVIPLVVLMFFGWLVKMVIGTNLSLPSKE